MKCVTISSTSISDVVESPLKPRSLRSMYHLCILHQIFRCRKRGGRGLQLFSQSVRVETLLLLQHKFSTGTWKTQHMMQSWLFPFWPFFFPQPEHGSFLKEKGVQSKEKSMQLCACCMRRVPSVPEEVTTVQVSGNQFLPLSWTSP